MSYISNKTIITFDVNGPLLNNLLFIGKVKANLNIHLKSLAIAYLQLQDEVSNEYDIEIQCKVKGKIKNMLEELKDNGTDILSKDSMIKYLKKEIKMVRKGMVMNNKKRNKKWQAITL